MHAERQDWTEDTDLSLQYTGYEPDSDTWETKQNLKNAPEILQDWEKLKAHQKRKSKVAN